VNTTPRQSLEPKLVGSLANDLPFVEFASVVIWLNPNTVEPEHDPGIQVVPLKTKHCLEDGAVALATSSWALSSFLSAKPVNQVR
jgi:hypothetical protein